MQSKRTKITSSDIVSKSPTEPKSATSVESKDSKLVAIMEQPRRPSMGSSLRRSKSMRRMSSRGFISQEEYASSVEKFIATVYAPELTSNSGRYSVLTIWLMLIICAIYGCMNVTINFKFEYFIPEGTVTDAYFKLDREYFNSGNSVTIYVENDEPPIDYSKAEV